MRGNFGAYELCRQQLYSCRLDPVVVLFRLDKIMIPSPQKHSLTAAPFRELVLAAQSSVI